MLSLQSDPDPESGVQIRCKLLFVFVLLSAWQAAPAAVSDSDIDRLLKLSGIVAQVEQFPELIKQGMREAQLTGDLISESDFSALLIRTDDTILPEEIVAEVRAALRETLTEEDLRNLLAWYRSDLGREIAELEERAGSAEAFESMAEQASELLANAERVEFARRVDRIVGATDLTMSIHEYTGIAVFSAITLALRPQSALEEIQQFREQMAALRPQIREPTERMVIVSFVYTYLPLGAHELDSFERFLSRPETTRFNQTVVRGLGRGLGRSIDKWAEALAKIFANQEQQI